MSPPSPMSSQQPWRDDGLFPMEAGDAVERSDQLDEPAVRQRPPRPAGGPPSAREPPHSAVGPPSAPEHQQHQQHQQQQQQQEQQRSVHSRAVLTVQEARFTVSKRVWLKTISTKHIVNDVTFSVRSGETLAIMGPSGAGKTTLLDLLTMEGGGVSKRTGFVDLNGTMLTPAIFKRCCSYVPQHDQGWAFLTCRESLEFAADLYKQGGREKNRKLVDELLRNMGLESCANNQVGNEFLKGLSGGQRRRLSLAVAMVKEPLVLFLDEITSGLDAAAAASIASFLQELARTKDIIIVCTIHQPSARVFAGFDCLLLLSGGREAYSGPVREAEEHFASLGLHISERENPADFFLDSVNADFADRAAVTAVLSAWESKVAKGIDVPNRGDVDLSLLQTGHSRSWPVEVLVLFRRSALLAVRDPTVYISRVVVFLVACSFFGIIYRESRNRVQSQVYQKFWLILWHMGVPACFSMAATLGQNIEVVSVEREVRAGMYRVSSFLTAQHLIQLPFMLVLALCVITVSGYGIAEWNIEGYWKVFVVTSIFLFAWECVAQFFGVAFKHPLIGMFNLISVWFASFLFAGLLVPEEDVPMPFRLLAKISPIKFATKAITYVEFSGTDFGGAVLDPSDPRGFRCTGDTRAECYGRTGLQVLDTLSHTALKHLSTKDDLLIDCLTIASVAAVVRVCYFGAFAARCRARNAVQRPGEPSCCEGC